MTIDLIYLNESKRIRTEYLNNLVFIVEKEDQIKSYLEEVQKINKDINEIVNISEDVYKEKMYEINKNIDGMKKYIDKYIENIKQLDFDQKKLYYSIKEKYPTITDNEIREQVMVYVEPLNKEFVKKNKTLFDRISQMEKDGKI